MRRASGVDLPEASVRPRRRRCCIPHPPGAHAPDCQTNGARARKLIRDAAAYAAGPGLPAAKDTPAIEAIFGDVDASACTETFTFGKDGKPFFVSGPNDTPARIRAITRTLQASRGGGGWNFLVAAAPGL